MILKIYVCILQMQKRYTKDIGYKRINITINRNRKLLSRIVDWNLLLMCRVYIFERFAV